MNPSRFIALHCGEEAQTLLSDHPNAFLILAQIAMRAKWRDCPITGLKAGQAFIGDWKKAGLRSRRAYQMSIERLEKGKLAVFQGGNRGTLATLTGTTIFSITKGTKGQPEGKLGVNKGTSEGHLGNTNHTDTLITKSTMSTKHTHNKATLEEVTAFCIEIGLPATDGDFMHTGCQKRLPKGRARRRRVQGVMTEWIDIHDRRTTPEPAFPARANFLQQYHWHGWFAGVR